MLRQRWLGRVPYPEALDLQHALFEQRRGDHLLLLEHPHVYTIGRSGDPANVLVDPESVGATFERVDRGGDVTYHGPGQLVGYPIIDVPGRRGGGLADTVAYVRSVEQLIIDTLAEFGLTADRLDRYPGVWLDTDGDRPRKIAAIGVRLTRGRSMHGFALNVDPALDMFGHIVPCGIADKAVTSMVAEGVHASMADVVDVVMRLAAERWGAAGVERQDVTGRPAGDTDLAPFSRGLGPGELVRPHQHGSSATTGPDQHGSSAPTGPDQDSSVVTGLSIGKAPSRLERRRAQAGIEGEIGVRERKPDWLRVSADMGPDFLELKRTMRQHSLVTVCEEAACPNIFECWNEGTATFMINGERCTRACGFCHVDTRKPEPPDPDEPARIADAVTSMRLQHAVITTVARDDLADHGARGFVESIEAIRRTSPSTAIEVLISDCRGDTDALGAIFDARPDVMNHNLETVARLQRVVRPSAGYARSLAVLARSKAAGLVTKSGLIVGMGETDDEVEGALADLAAVGCDIVTIGQYLRPTTNHLPVHRWVEPATFARYTELGRALGIAHVESSPLTRSSHHAGVVAEQVGVTTA